MQVDLHIHSYISLCADAAMTPSNIIKKAESVGLSMIAIADHNCSLNTASLEFSSKIKIIPAIEVTTKEEVHVLALFETYPILYAFQEQLNGYGRLVFAHPSLSGIDISIEELIELIHSFDGLAIAAHCEREAFSVIGQLGMLPTEFKFDAIEIAHREAIDRFRESGLCIILNSDAHSLDQIGSNFSKFHLLEASFLELKKAILECNVQL